MGMAKLAPSIELQTSLSLVVRKLIVVVIGSQQHQKLNTYLSEQNKHRRRRLLVFFVTDSVIKYIHTYIKF